MGLFKGVREGKRAKVDVRLDGEEDGGEDEFLPEDHGLNKEHEVKEGEIYLTKEVRELMAKYVSYCYPSFISRVSEKETVPNARYAPVEKVEEEEEEDIPKIYYTSRTHSQLRQLTSELLKTRFPHPPVPDDSAATTEPGASGVSLVPLASRRQLCINDKVRALGKGGNDERLNEACLDMQKAGEPSFQDSGAGLNSRQDKVRVPAEEG